MYEYVPVAQDIINKAMSIHFILRAFKVTVIDEDIPPA